MSCLGAAGRSRSVAGSAIGMLRIMPLLGGLLLLGCLSDPPVPGEPEEQLAFVLDSAVRDLDPRFTVDEASMQVSRLIYSGLVSVDNARVTPELDLAEAVERRDECPADVAVFDEPVCYRVRVRQGVRWHDGALLTGADVVHTYRSILDAELGSPYRGSYGRKFIDVRPVKGDPYAADFVLFDDYATFLTDLVMGIVPAHLADEDTGESDRRYIGTGPFKFHSRLAGRRVIFERNGDYHLGAPGVRYLVFRTIEDEGTRLLALVGGTGDMMLNAVSPVLLDVVERQPGVVVESIPSLIWGYMAFNLRDPVVGSLEVRRALFYAIDVEEIIARKMHGYADPSTGMLSPISWAHEDSLERPARDRAKAEALLDQAGFPRDPDTGVRFELQVKISTDRFRRSVARSIAHQLAGVGVEVEIRSFELGTFLSDVRQGNFQATILNLPDPSEPDMLRWMFFSLSTPEAAPAPRRAVREADRAFADRRFFPPALGELIEGDDPDCRAWAREELARGIGRFISRAWGRRPPRDVSNRTYYADPRFDCLVMRAWEEPDRELRRPLYQEAQRILARDLPVLPLWHEHRVLVRRERVRGFEVLPNGRLTPLARVTLEDGVYPPGD